MASLIVTSGANEGDYYPLGQRTVVIGRQESCPVQILDDRVSRKHVQIRHNAESDTYHVLDMKSANGSWLNGRRLETELELVDNDELLIGDSRLLFTTQDFPDRATAWSHFKKVGQRAKPTIEQR